MGYDLATGLGTPKANLLIPYLATYDSTSSTGTATAPAAPASLTATAASVTSVNLSWPASTGATGYYVYELENGRSVLVGTYAAGTTSASITGLTAATTYSFKVAAFNSAGSTATAWAQVTTPAAPVTAPQNFQVTATSSTAATLSWQAVSGATGYQVFERSGNSAVQIGSVAAGTTSFSVTGLSAGSTYSFYVSAYNANSSACNGLDVGRHAGRGETDRAGPRRRKHFDHGGTSLLDRQRRGNRLPGLLLERPTVGRARRLWVGRHGREHHGLVRRLDDVLRRRGGQQYRVGLVPLGGIDHAGAVRGNFSRRSGLRSGDARHSASRLVAVSRPWCQ